MCLCMRKRDNVCVREGERERKRKRPRYKNELSSGVPNFTPLLGIGMIYTSDSAVRFRIAFKVLPFQVICLILKRL